MRREILSDLMLAMDTVVLERMGAAAFKIISPIPAWFAPFCDDRAPDPVLIRPGIELSFLEHFLEEAEVFWEAHSQGELRSGPWSERTAQGGTGKLEAVAYALAEARVLAITRLGTDVREKRAVLQRARENQLVLERLERTQKALQRSEQRNRRLIAQLEVQQANLVAVLDQLRVGTLLVDTENRILFANRSFRHIVGLDEGKVPGRDWKQVLPFPEMTKAKIETMLERPVGERSRISTDLELTDNRRYWMEIDIQDDPQCAGRHVIFLYDVSEVQDLRRLIEERGDVVRMAGKSAAIERVFQDINDLGRLDTTILIEGETGTGKELVARELHAVSNRIEKPFVAINCAGLTESLLTSQLFGHKKGSFTGAVADQQGLFEAAQGGTLFLDEIGDMPPAVQASLLRVVQEREITRIGETRPRKIDVRIVAATHRDLGEEVAHGRFRSDLFYRINVARIRLPPLREREGDLSLLSELFVQEFREAISKPVRAFSPEAARLLAAHHWPGNVRELRSAVEFAVIRCRGASVQPEDLPPDVCADRTPLTRSEPEPTRLTALAPADEKERLQWALEKSGGNRTAAAKLLNISRATLYRRLADYDFVGEGP